MVIIPIYCWDDYFQLGWLFPIYDYFQTTNHSQNKKNLWSFAFVESTYYFWSSPLHQNSPPLRPPVTCSNFFNSFKTSCRGPHWSMVEPWPIFIGKKRWSSIAMEGVPLNFQTTIWLWLTVCHGKSPCYCAVALVLCCAMKRGAHISNRNLQLGLLMLPYIATCVIAIWKVQKLSKIAAIQQETYPLGSLGVIVDDAVVEDAYIPMCWNTSVYHSYPQGGHTRHGTYHGVTERILDSVLC